MSAYTRYPGPRGIRTVLSSKKKSRVGRCSKVVIEDSGCAETERRNQAIVQRITTALWWRPMAKVLLAAEHSGERSVWRRV